MSSNVVSKTSEREHRCLSPFKKGVLPPKERRGVERENE